MPDGGGFDGALGVVSAFAAIDLLRERGFVPARPIAVVAFAEEEGARFGVACLGSKLLTGAITPSQAAGLRDADGVSLAAAMAAARHDPDLIGPDEELLARIGAFIELHIEQGRALADEPGAPLGIGEGIWPHGRWRLDFLGRADHAGTAMLADRSDPTLPFAATVLEARQAAMRHGGLATFGKMIVEPGGANAVCSAVRAWLDARAPEEEPLANLVAAIRSAAHRFAAEHGVTVRMWQESFSPAVAFDPDLRDRLSAVIAAGGIGGSSPRASAAGGIGGSPTQASTAQGKEPPVLRTGAGHDAGVLAGRLPTAMLFVRNPTGVSHAPAEHADLADCAAGVAALAAVLEDLTSR